MELKRKIEKIMEAAKQFLLSDGSVPPAAVFCKEGFPDFAMPLQLADEESKEKAFYIVQFFIRSNRPDAAVIVSETWVKKIQPEEIKNYRRGDVAKSADRGEAISVFGGSPEGSFGMVQRFHRDEDAIIFDGPAESVTGIEIGFFGTVWDEISTEQKTNWN